MKTEYSRFRELMSVPKNKTMVKLGAYLAFFVLFFILAAFAGGGEPAPDFNRIMSYPNMLRVLSENSVRVKYKITANKEYFIEGTIVNNILSGTLEIEEKLYRLRIEEEKAYIIVKDEAEETNLLDAINLIFLIPANIVDIIGKSNIETRSEDNRTITYSIDNKHYTVHTSETEIIKIILVDGDITYEMEFTSIN